MRVFLQAPGVKALTSNQKLGFSKPGRDAHCQSDFPTWSRAALMVNTPNSSSPSPLPQRRCRIHTHWNFVLRNYLNEAPEA